MEGVQRSNTVLGNSVYAYFTVDVVCFASLRKFESFIYKMYKLSNVYWTSFFHSRRRCGDH